MAAKRKTTNSNVAKITEQELTAYLTLREQYEQARKSVNQMEKAVKGTEENLINRLKSGEIVEGNIDAVVIQEEGACRPAWKEEYLTHMESHGITRDTATLQVQQRTVIPVKDVLKVAPKASK